MLLWQFIIFVLSPLVFMYFRIEWVFKHRFALIDEIYGTTPEDAQKWFHAGCPKLEDYYPSSTTMILKFWIWDADKFLLKDMFTRS